MPTQQHAPITQDGVTYTWDSDANGYFDADGNPKSAPSAGLTAAPYPYASGIQGSYLSSPHDTAGAPFSYLSNPNDANGVFGAGDFMGYVPNTNARPEVLTADDLDGQAANPRLQALGGGVTTMIGTTGTMNPNYQQSVQQYITAGYQPKYDEQGNLIGLIDPNITWGPNGPTQSYVRVGPSGNPDDTGDAIPVMAGIGGLVGGPIMGAIVGGAVGQMYGNDTQSTLTGAAAGLAGGYAGNALGISATAGGTAGAAGAGTAAGSGSTATAGTTAATTGTTAATGATGGGVLGTGYSTGVAAIDAAANGAAIGGGVSAISGGNTEENMQAAGIGGATAGAATAISGNGQGGQPYYDPASGLYVNPATGATSTTPPSGSGTGGYQATTGTGQFLQGAVNGDWINSLSNFSSDPMGALSNFAASIGASIQDVIANPGAYAGKLGDWAQNTGKSFFDKATSSTPSPGSGGSSSFGPQQVAALLNMAGGISTALSDQYGAQDSTPDWYKSSAQDVLAKAKAESERGYTPYTGDAVAGLTANELQAQQLAHEAGLKYAGAQPDYLSTAADYANKGAETFPGSAGLDQYMNPYLQGVLDPALRDMQQQYQIEQRNNADRAVTAGAFGGSRQGIREGLSFDDYLKRTGDLSNQVRSDAWGKGASLWQADRDAQARAASQFGTLSGAYDAQRGNAMNALTQTGATARGVDQAKKTFDYNQFLEGRDWTGAQLGKYANTVATTRPGTQTPAKDKTGAVLGAIASGIGLWGG